MLTEEIREQVKTVLHARMIEDKAFRAVMAISQATPSEEIVRRAREYERCVQLVQRQEHLLASYLIKETVNESEAQPT